MENDEQPQKLGGAEPLNKRQQAAADYKIKREKQAAEKLILQAEYRKIADGPVVKDLLAKVEAFAGLHMKVAKDGEAYKQSGVDKDNQPVLSIVSLNQEDRTRHMDKASGIEEIENYLKGMLAPPTK